MGKQSIKFHPQISQVSPLSRCAQSFLHKKNSLHNIMAEQGPKVGDARSLWNFTPSPGILLYACSFFLSLCLLRVCVVMMMSWFWGRSSLAFEFLKRWCENDMRFLVLLLARRLSLSRKRDYSQSGSVFVPLLYSLWTCDDVFFFIFNAHQNASFHRTTKQDGRNRRLKI